MKFSTWTLNKMVPAENRKKANLVLIDSALDLAGERYNGPIVGLDKMTEWARKAFQEAWDKITVKEVVEIDLASPVQKENSQ